MDFFKDLLKPEIIWFIIGVVLLILEFAVPGLVIFFFFFFTIIFYKIDLVVDRFLDLALLIFFLCFLFLLLTLRRFLKKVFTGKVDGEKNERGQDDEFIGNKVQVIKQITPEEDGKVEFRGTSWQASAAETIKKGEHVIITGKNNITLTVKKNNQGG